MEVGREPIHKLWRVGAAALFSLAGGCISLEAASAGQVGCRPDDIVITDDTGRLGMSRTWIATCQGAAYSCAAITVGEKHEQINCSPLDRRGQAAAASQPVAATSAAAVSTTVARGFDSQRNAPFVKGSFQVQGGLRVGVLGSPHVHPGKILFALQGATEDAALRDCRTLSVLVNAVPAAALETRTQAKPGRVHVEVSFDASVFRPLSKSYPELTLVACTHRFAFDAAQLADLQKLLVINAEMAAEAAPSSGGVSPPPAELVAPWQ